VVERVCDDTGERFGVAEAWLRYAGHRSGKRIAMNERDAGYWLGTVMVPEARKERRAASDRAANAQRLGKPPGLVEHERRKLSPEEQRKQDQLMTDIMLGKVKPPGRTGT
jgi:hypothetical protein